MPRKKSVSGRRKKPSMVNRINLQIKRINKQIKRLERSGDFGTYKSRELIDFVKRMPELQMKKSKSSKRHRVQFKAVQTPTVGSLRLISKKFDEIIKSRVFSVIGIRRMRKEIRKKVTKTLSEQLGRELTKKEVDQFYEIVQYKETEILDKISPSDFYQLVEVAKDQGADEDTWVSILNNYVTINNEYIREQAKELYYKFVA